MADTRRWLIFCMRRGWWWRADECGYTKNVREAGQYTDAAALAVVERMNDGGDCAVQLVPAEAAGREVYVAKGVKRMEP